MASSYSCTAFEYKYDLTTTDPLGRQSLFGFIYDYANQPLRSQSLDSGLTTIVFIGPFEHRYEVRSSVVDKEQNLIRMEGLAQLRVGDKLDGDLDDATQYFLQDVLSSVTVTLSATGAELSKQEFYPFGETAYGSYSKNRYMFTGKEKEDCSGLYYYGARFYAPWTCRFISVDPV